MSVTLPGINIPSHTIYFGGLASNDFLVLLVVGLIAGLLASRVVGVGGGLLLDMVVGVIGAFLGRWIFGLFNINLGPGDPKRRSEEHTSELQSHLNLVCRLLLEKKKNKKDTNDML